MELTKQTCPKCGQTREVDAESMSRNPDAWWWSSDDICYTCEVSDLNS